MLQKTNIPGYYKDTKTGAIINKNENELLEYKAKISSSKDIQNLQNEVNNIKNNLVEIKEMLTFIIKKS